MGAYSCLILRSFSFKVMFRVVISLEIIKDLKITKLSGYLGQFPA
jgi:hypothetical protein